MKKLVKQVINGEIVEVEIEVDDDNNDDNNLDANANANANANDNDNNDDNDDDDDSSDSNDDDDGSGDDDGEKETWMTNENDQKLSDVPVSTHIRMKRKLKGRLSDSNEEVDRLKKENEVLRAQKVSETSIPKEPLKRPKEQEFDTINEFDEALTKYEDEMLQIRLVAVNKKSAVENAQIMARTNLDKTVDSHYERAAKLIQDNGIDTEVYKKADLAVREAIETIRPGQGDIIADQVISVLGEGSEKVLYFLGRNKNALNEFKSLLADDASGLKASMFLGKQQERLLSLKQKTSNAPSPDSDIHGDTSKTSSSKAVALLKKRKAAIKKGDIQVAYDIKKQAKAGGIDVSAW